MRKRVTACKKAISSNWALPAHESYKIGIKMLYGADGVTYDLSHAKQSLQLAAQDTEFDKRARLHLGICNLAAL